MSNSIALHKERRTSTALAIDVLNFQSMMVMFSLAAKLISLYRVNLYYTSVCYFV